MANFDFEMIRKLFDEHVDVDRAAWDMMNDAEKAAWLEKKYKQLAGEVADE